MASTTSTQDSGLFDVLIPAFEKAYPQYKIKVIAVGSGEAIKLGETKDADVLLVHSPAAEKKFIAAGFATERNDVMYNDFVIVGPPADPAGVKGSASAAEAIKKIAEAGKAGKATFVSRGDDSGTDAKEMTLWAGASDRHADARSQPVVPLDRPGHGRDPQDRRREGRLHARRPRDVALDEGPAARASRSCSRRTRRCSTSTASSSFPVRRTRPAARRSRTTS